MRTFVGTGRGNNGPTKKERQEMAREHARIAREEARIKARRRKWYTQGSIGLAILVGLAIAGFVVVNAVQPAGPGPKNMASDGIVLTSTTQVDQTPALKAGANPVPTKQTNKAGVAHIVEYIDYQCPYCNQFETTNAEQLGTWLDGGFATLEIHPIALLDSSSSGTKYSTRSANAAACVANDKPSAFFAMNSALFADQPKEGGTGLTNAKILSILNKAGAGGSDIEKCVNDQKFSAFVAASTKRALTKPLPNSTLDKVTGTPTVIVNGTQYTGSLTDAKAFATFVQGLMTGGDSNSTSTPTPTPTATPGN
jgi:protein-disulfide isomerase